ncbi:DUF4044 domain-containing protein [Candidatus Woesebacteria bacterium]|nr:DUF4044 domain-containing protein [Candidatus Woesebacteria bacterium]
MSLSRKKREKIIRFFVIFAVVIMVFSSIASLLFAFF